jgi:hypothetical protein
MHERQHARAAVPANQHPAALLGRALAECAGEHRDVVGRVVGSRPAGAQQRADVLTGATRPVIEESQHAGAG